MIKYFLALFFNLIALVVCFYIHYVNFTFAVHNKDKIDAVPPWSPTTATIALIAFYVLMIVYAFLSYKIAKWFRQRFTWSQKIPLYFFGLAGFCVSILFLVLVSVAFVAVLSKAYQYVP